MKEIYDPRDTLTHDIVEGQVYGDARQANRDSNGNITDFEEKLRLVYVDDERVLLRSDFIHDRGGHKGRHHYRCESREVFEEEASEERYKLLEEPDDPPRMPTDGVASALTVLKHLQAKEKHKVNNGAGRKSQHRLEALNDAVEAVSNIDPTPIQWDKLDGVGAKTAENLNEAGFETDVDVQSASDAQLLDVDGVGNKNLKNIKEEAGAS